MNETPQVNGIAILTHARKEPFFTSMWARYYGQLFGHDNLFFVKDGDDWDLPPDAEIGNVIQTQFPGSRKNCDLASAEFLSRHAAALLEDYEAVLRVDIDEFLTVDPARGTWEDVKVELQQAGYLYALGLDVIHNDSCEAPFDAQQPVLAQRAFAQVSGAYCKPHAISRPVTWTSACHAIEDGPVRLSNYLFMFHLAGLDRQITYDRLVDRGDFNQRSYEGHASRRLRDFETIKQSDPTPFDEVIDVLRQKITFDENGAAKMSPRFGKINGRRSINVLIPERFAGLI